jgi:hypothetical protein
MATHRFTQGWAATLAIVLALALSACGGGGGSAASSPTVSAAQAALPTTLVEDTLPATAGENLASLAYNPMGAGDSWTYARLDASGTDTGAFVVKTVVAGSADSGSVTVEESSADLGGVLASYTVNSLGSFDADPLGEAPVAAKTLVGSLLDFPVVFYPEGSEQRSVRQGSWGADVDGDGRADAFRLEVRIAYLGEEDLATATSQTPVHVVHLRKTVVFTLYTTAAGGGSQSATATEETWSQAGVGAVQIVRSTYNASGTLQDRYTLRLQEAVVGGSTVGTPLTAP